MRYTLGTTNAKNTAGKYKLTIKLSKKQLQKTFLIRIYKLSNLNQRLVTDSDDEAIMEWILPQGNYLIKYLESGTLKKQKLISLNGDTIVSLMDSYLPEYTSNKFMLDPYDDTFSTQLTNEAPEDWNIVFTESQTITFTDLHGTKAIDVFVVGGGGAGGQSYGKAGSNVWYSSGGGGGGGGECVNAYNIPIQTNTPYKIIVGAGGKVTSISISSTSQTGANGEDSSAFGITAKGGNGGHSGTTINSIAGGGGGGLAQTQKLDSDGNTYYVGNGGRGCGLLGADYSSNEDLRYTNGVRKDDIIKPFNSTVSNASCFGQGGGGGDGYQSKITINGYTSQERSAIEIIENPGETYSGCTKMLFFTGIDSVINYDGIIPDKYLGTGGTYVTKYALNSKTINNQEYQTACPGAPNSGNGGGGGFSYTSSIANAVLPGDGGSGVVIIRNHRE